MKNCISSVLGLMESKKFVQAILVLTSHMACDIKKDETVHATLHACDDDEARKT